MKIFNGNNSNSIGPGTVREMKNWFDLQFFFRYFQFSSSANGCSVEISIYIDALTTRTVDNKKTNNY